MKPVFLMSVEEAFSDDLGAMLRPKNGRWHLYETQLQKSGCIFCEVCGLKASHSMLYENGPTEKTLAFVHKKDGEYVRFDIDHILPQSMLGNHKDCNLQIVCRICNLAKADAPSESEELEIICSIEKHLKDPSRVAAANKYNKRAQKRLVKAVNKFNAWYISACKRHQLKATADVLEWYV